MEHLSNNSWSVNSIRYFLLNIAQPSPFPGMDENSRHMNYLQQKDQAEQCRKKWLLCFRAMQASEWFALWRKEMRGRAQLGSRKSNECQISECLRYHPPKESRSGIVLVDNRFSIRLPRLIISLSWFCYKKDNHVSFRDLLCTTTCWNPWMANADRGPAEQGIPQGETHGQNPGVVSKGSLGLLGLHPLHQPVLGTAWLQCCLLLLWPPAPALVPENTLASSIVVMILKASSLKFTNCWEILL